MTTFYIKATRKLKITTEITQEIELSIDADSEADAKTIAEVRVSLDRGMAWVDTRKPVIAHEESADIKIECQRAPDPGTPTTGRPKPSHNLAEAQQRAIEKHMARAKEEAIESDQRAIEKHMARAKEEAIESDQRRDKEPWPPVDSPDYRQREQMRLDGVKS